MYQTTMDVFSSEQYWTVKPKPGFCVKLRIKKSSANGESSKLFFNFSTCDELPPPAMDIDEDQLAVILESSEPGTYRIPISVGEIRDESDNRGESAKTIDIILNQGFYTTRVIDSELFRTFLVLVAIEAVESKHPQLSNEIDRQNWIVLKNRKSMGDLREQRIRKEKRPMIQLLDDGCELIEIGPHDKIEIVPPTELDEVESSTKSKSNQSTRTNPKSKLIQSTNATSKLIQSTTKSKSITIEPRYEIRKDHPRNPTQITATFRLGATIGVKSMDEIELDIGEHRIRVAIPRRGFCEDVFVAMSLDEKRAKAKLFVDDGKLIVEIPLKV